MTLYTQKIIRKFKIKNIKDIKKIIDKINNSKTYQPFSYPDYIDVFYQNYKNFWNKGIIVLKKAVADERWKKYYYVEMQNK